MKSRFDDFDERFDKAKRYVAIQAVISVLVGLTFVGFMGWVIVKVMNHFGII